MNFHEYVLSKSMCDMPEIKAISTQDFYCMVYNEIKNGRPASKSDNILLTELTYLQCRRPFYNVYPAVVSTLENTRLDFRLSQIDSLGQTISVCFAVGKEPVAKQGKINAMLIQIEHDQESLTENTVYNIPVVRILMNKVNPDGTVRFSSLQYSGDEVLSGALGEDDDDRRIISLAVGISMLASDERFAAPILLKRDQGKELEGDALKKAIERARNRGRNGMTIGKDLEVSPHMRRPHFAIRWTGKGGVTPKLVPVQGCVVNKSKLFPIPTGYLDK